MEVLVARLDRAVREKSLTINPFSGESTFSVNGISFGIPLGWSCGLTPISQSEQAFVLSPSDASLPYFFFWTIPPLKMSMNQWIATLSTKSSENLTELSSKSIPMPPGSEGRHAEGLCTVLKNIPLNKSHYRIYCVIEQDGRFVFCMYVAVNLLPFANNIHRLTECLINTPKLMEEKDLVTPEKAIVATPEFSSIKHSLAQQLEHLLENWIFVGLFPDESEISNLKIPEGWVEGYFPKPDMPDIQSVLLCKSSTQVIVVTFSFPLVDKSSDIGASIDTILTNLHSPYTVVASDVIRLDALQHHFDSDAIGKTFFLRKKSDQYRAYLCHEINGFIRCSVFVATDFDSFCAHEPQWLEWMGVTVNQPTDNEKLEVAVIEDELVKLDLNQKTAVPRTVGLFGKKKTFEGLFVGGEMSIPVSDGSGKKVSVWIALNMVFTEDGYILGTLPTSGNLSHFSSSQIIPLISSPFIHEVNYMVGIYSMDWVKKIITIEWKSTALIGQAFCPPATISQLTLISNDQILIQKELFGSVKDITVKRSQPFPGEGIQIAGRYSSYNDPKSKIEFFMDGTISINDSYLLSAFNEQNSGAVKWKYRLAHFTMEIINSKSGSRFFTVHVPSSNGDFFIENTPYVRDPTSGADNSIQSSSLPLFGSKIPLDCLEGLYIGTAKHKENGDWISLSLLFTAEGKLVSGSVPKSGKLSRLTMKDLQDHFSSSKTAAMSLKGKYTVDTSGQQLSISWDTSNLSSLHLNRPKKPLSTGSIVGEILVFPEEEFETQKVFQLTKIVPLPVEGILIEGHYQSQQNPKISVTFFPDGTLSTTHPSILSKFSVPQVRWKYRLWHYTLEVFGDAETLSFTIYFTDERYRQVIIDRHPYLYRPSVVN